MSEPIHTVYLLLGSNLGDRISTLRHAREAISDEVGPILLYSALYETAAWGVTHQPSFLNQVLKVLTPFGADEVLKMTQRIEQHLGRVRREKWGSRVIDIDILYFDSEAIQSEHLTIPHPFLHERRFTLVPLAEIAPSYLHPVLKKTSRQLLDECRDELEVVKLV